LHAAHGGLQIVADFVNPERQDVPAQVGEAAGTKLVSAAQLAVPVAMIVFAIHFDVQFALAVKDREIR
jgi:hypothetical protein